MFSQFSASFSYLIFIYLCSRRSIIKANMQILHNQLHSSFLIIEFVLKINSRSKLAAHREANISIERGKISTTASPGCGLSCLFPLSLACSLLLRKVRCLYARSIANIIMRRVLYNRVHARWRVSLAYIQPGAGEVPGDGIPFKCSANTVTARDTPRGNNPLASSLSLSLSLALSPTRPIMYFASGAAPVRTAAVAPRSIGFISRAQRPSTKARPE